MQSTTLAPSETAVLAMRGTKRKPISTSKQVRKKPRQSEPVSDCESSEFLSDESSESETDEKVNKAATPQTPLSAKASPRFPSLLKTIHCTYEGCEKTFNRPARLAEHLRSHTNTRDFVCPHAPCTKDFLRETHLKHHIKSAHSDVRNYVCQWVDCGKSFVTNTRLKRHHLSHEGREKYRCSLPGCGQSFRKHGTLQRHQTTAHEGRPAFVCEEEGEDGNACGAGFNTAGKLKTHQGRIHGSSRYWCLMCQQQTGAKESAFSTYSAFQEHNKMVHPPSCINCGLECSSNRELRRHIESQHGGQQLSERQTHICPEQDCGKGFTKKGNMLVHVKTVHGGQKAFSCGGIGVEDLNNVQGWDAASGCGKSFSAKSSLEEHIRSAHLCLSVTAKKTSRSKSNAKKNRKKKPTAIDMLTGTRATDTDGDDCTRTSTMPIPCLLPGCQFVFERAHERNVHMYTHHGFGLDNHDIEDTPMPDQDINSNQDLDFNALDAAALSGSGNFWLIQDCDGAIPTERPEDDREWAADEEEMRRLIGVGENDDGVNGPFIDPSFL